MAFNSKNLTLLQPRVGSAEGEADAGYGTALWAYRDITANDNLAAMQTDGFITSAADYGLQIGDVVIMIEDTVDASWMLVSGLTGGDADTIVISNP
jgi:hypothetical protein